MLKSAAPARKPYRSDVSDEEWAFVVPGRWLPGDLLPWYTVYQQAQRWIKAGVFEAMGHDLCVVLRLADVDANEAAGREPHPSAVILDGTILQSTPERGHRAGYNGHSGRRARESRQQGECEEERRIHTVPQVSGEA